MNTRETLPNALPTVKEITDTLPPKLVKSAEIYVDRLNLEGLRLLWFWNTVALAYLYGREDGLNSGLKGLSDVAKKMSGLQAESDQV